MKEFSRYVDGLDQPVRDASAGTVIGRLAERMDAALDGEAGHALRDLVGLEERRASGG